MLRGKPTTNSADSGAPTKTPSDPPLSLSRLRDAFAVMLGSAKENKPQPTQHKQSPAKDDEQQAAPPRPCEVNARTVVEAILFVGRPDNGPHSSRELAAAMRGVSPAEIDAAVAELNALYDVDSSPYRIEQINGGFRLTLRPEFERMRDKFYGRVKEARLSPTVLEVLSVLAYNQPATIDQLNEIRGTPSGAALATLVRRRLVKLERSGERGKPAQYSTTDRFLQLFGLDGLETLPRVEEVERV